MALLWSGQAGAQPLPGADAAAGVRAAERDYDVAPGELGRALTRFAEQAGIQLSAPAAMTDGRRSPGLRGRQSVSSGLAALLAGTGLEAVNHGAGRYTLRTSPAPRAEAGPPSGVERRLPPVLVTAPMEARPGGEVYDAPRSLAYVSADDLDRFTRISPGDVLKGVPGVQVGDSRNGGGLDVNIRGIQGQSRVAVTVDGARQSIDVYRSYAGTQERSYVDPDLLSDVLVSKGPGLGTAEMGAIGGSVQMRTLEAADLVASGQRFGLRLKGNLWDNGVSPVARSRTEEIVGVEKHNSLYAIPRSDRASLFGSDAQSGSLALAYAGEQLELVAALARRRQGNYFAGRHGNDRYRTYHTTPDGWVSENFTVASTYLPGEEVMNTSSETRSALLKATLRPAGGHELGLSYMRFDGDFGEIMPTDVLRQNYKAHGIVQYPLGTMRIGTWTARYGFKPGNDLVDLSARLWMSDARNDQLNTADNGPRSLRYTWNRGWTKQQHRRVGGELSNRTRFSSGVGEFVLDLGGSALWEDISPQKSVVTTQDDRNWNSVLRDATRREFGLNGRLAFKPTDAWEIWGGGRYSQYRSRDRNQHSNALYETVVDPEDGWVSRRLLGFAFQEPRRHSDSGFAPAFGVNYQLSPQTLVYASHVQALRMPSLFETSEGTWGIDPAMGPQLRPEKARTLEVGLSTRRKGLLSHNDDAAFKLAYFNNDIRNLISRYDRKREDLVMWFSNADRFRTRGLEFQLSYDNGRFFSDFSHTYYLKTETCDAGYVAYLKSNPYSASTNQNTPDCVSGSFMGSYVSTQNPPRSSTHWTLGTRLFERRLEMGLRMVHTSGPLARTDKPWNETSFTTTQLRYLAATVYDAFLSYKLREGLSLNVALHNLTDRYYLDPLAQSMMPAPGRTLRLGMQIRF